MVDEQVRRNRRAWNVAARKYVEESDAILEQVRDGRSAALLDGELVHLAPLLERRPVVVHLQSGQGTDDLDLARRGAAHVVGVDFGVVTTQAAAGRAAALDHDDVTYAVGDALATPLRDGCADLVYTGKGALMWLPDLMAWAREAARLLRPGTGELFVYEAHPVAPLWTRDADVARLRTDVDYFGGRRDNDTFPASAIERFGDGATPAAVEFQWPLATIVNAVIDAGLTVAHLGEHADPFWKPADRADTAAWRGTLPNAFSLLARRGAD